jgi:hypothetical protein
MKMFLFTCLSSLIFSVCLAQNDGQHIPIALLKESGNIDDLMKLALKDEPRLGRANKLTLRDSCWFLEIDRQNGGKIIYFSIMPGKKLAINYYINDLEQRKQRYGFFTYRRYLVFVDLKSESDDFFTNTGSIRTFDFLFFGNKANILQADLYDHFMHYQFLGNRMSEEGLPPTMELQIK